MFQVFTVWWAFKEWQAGVKSFRASFSTLCGIGLINFFNFSEKLNMLLAS